MTTIACLGWGSLIWCHGNLPIRRGWVDDGPLVSVEFARQSRGGRITLVIVRGARPVPALWALIDSDCLDEARQQLRKREGTIDRCIKHWSRGMDSPKCIPELSDWAIAKDLTHVIWTGLPPKFEGEQRVPTEKEVLNYLHQLRGKLRDDAERYIRCAPRQICTKYRRRIEAELQWFPIK